MRVPSDTLLLSPDLHPLDTPAAAYATRREPRPEPVAFAPDLAARVAAIEAAVTAMEKQIAELRADVVGLLENAVVQRPTE